MAEVSNHLQRVYLAADVYAICLQHAFTTEKEEVMGLLIGEVDESKGHSHISACIILHRSDKQPDRVEISPEQLCTASNHAEKLTAMLDRPMRVLGWYHSHPHITVWPSHVDVLTQSMYQTMDPWFVGLIFSVYTSDAGSVGNQIQLTCFQASGNASNLKRREIQIVIEKSPLNMYNLSEIKDLPKILVQEELQSHETEEKNKVNDVLADLHNEAIKTSALVHIVSKVAKPIYEDLEERLHATNLRIKELEKLLEEL